MALIVTLCSAAIKRWGHELGCMYFAVDWKRHLQTIFLFGGADDDSGADLNGG
jgi:hypothetical protein